MDRVVSQLITELDGVTSGGGGGGGGGSSSGGGSGSEAANIFVIGATNRPDLLDQSLLRPGRFDRLLYLGIDQSPLNRYCILAFLILLLKINDEPSMMNDEGSRMFP